MGTGAEGGGQLGVSVAANDEGAQALWDGTGAGVRPVQHTLTSDAFACPRSDSNRSHSSS